MFEFRPAQDSDASVIARLLTDNGLPGNDFFEHLEHFFVAQANSGVMAVGGLELIPQLSEDASETLGLIRSFAVDIVFRHQGVAEELLRQTLKYAEGLGISDLYLLTETADQFFSTRGFVALDRDLAPEPVRRTRQFSELCPGSAILMHRGM